jgi:hypothetical protein
MLDLNNLVTPNSGCELIGATRNSPDINDAGQIAVNRTCNGEQHAVLLTPIYKAEVQPPIHANGSSVFPAKRGVIPLKFKLLQQGFRTCMLPPATIEHHQGVRADAVADPREHLRLGRSERSGVPDRAHSMPLHVLAVGGSARERTGWISASTESWWGTRYLRCVEQPELGRRWGRGQSRYRRDRTPAARVPLRSVSGGRADRAGRRR